MLKDTCAKIEKILYYIESIFACIAFTFIFVTVCLQVVQRFFNLPIIDTSDISIICQPVLAFFCVSLLMYSGGHITVEVQKLLKNKKLYLIVEFLAHVFTLIFAGAFIWLGYDLLLFAVETGTSTMALRIPLWIPYGSMFVGMILLAVHGISALLQTGYHIRHIDEYDAGEIDIESMR